MNHKVCSQCQYKLPIFAKFCRMCGVAQDKIDVENKPRPVVLATQPLSSIENIVKTEASNGIELKQRDEIEANSLHIEQNEKLKIEKVEFERRILEAEQYKKKSLETQNQKEELARQLESKVMEGNRKEQERIVEIRQMSDAHAAASLNQEKALEQKELERQNQIKTLELEYAEAIRMKEEESKNAALEIEAASSEINRINQEKLRLEVEKEAQSKMAALERAVAAAELNKINEEKAKIENEKQEYAKRYEASQASVRRMRNIVLYGALALTIAGLLIYQFVYQDSSRNSSPRATPSAEKPKEVINKPKDKSALSEEKTTDKKDVPEPQKASSVDDPSKDIPKPDPQESKKE